ncbi:MAG: PIN domain-containing protein [bacterium]
MKTETFIDTSGFYALLVRRDEMHRKAARILKTAAKSKTTFVTTDYVLDETATLLKARSLAHLLERFFEIVISSGACRIEWMDAERFESTVADYLKVRDQGWSFTDTFSFLLMKQLQLSRALTKDHHFREAGFVPLLT